VNDRARTVLFLVSAAAVAAVLIEGIAGLSPFGTHQTAYAAMLLRVAVLERHVLNVATAVNFDYRGFDTLGEEFILFTSIAGVLIIFSELRGGKTLYPEPMDGPADRGRTAAIRAFATGLAAFVAAMGMNVALHTSITPGGGFQGGAIFGSAVVCIYLGAGYAALDRTAKKSLLDTLEALGAAAFALIGVATAFLSGAFLKNSLPLGAAGSIPSGGTIFAINAAVFVEVGCGFALLLLLYLHQTCKTEEEQR